MQSCCSPIASASAAAPRWHRSASTACSPVCIHFSCCSQIASASAAARRLRPLQLLLPDYITFNCSPMRALRLLLHPLVVPASCSSPCVLRGVRGSVNLSTKVVHHESSPSPRTSHFCHTHTHRHTHIIY